MRPVCDFCLRAYLQSKRASAVVVAAGFTEGFEAGMLRHVKTREAMERHSLHRMTWQTARQSISERCLIAARLRSC